jgi:hypothetical protein
VRYDDGIHLFTYDRNPVSGQPDAGWLERILQGSARGGTTGDCPSEDRWYDSNPCSGLTSCTEQLGDTSEGFGLARTESGRSFASWVAYSSQGSYTLTEEVYWGEMPVAYCSRFEAGGSGTADLVVARLTEAEPVLTHFRFDTGSALPARDYLVAMAARGETLLVAAMLSGDPTRALTYLELDSRLLP